MRMCVPARVRVRVRVWRRGYPHRRHAAPPRAPGRSWIKLMSRWLVQMAFSFVVVDVGVVYLRYNLYCAFKSRFVKRAT